MKEYLKRKIGLCAFMLVFAAIIMPSGGSSNDGDGGGGGGGAKKTSGITLCHIVGGVFMTICNDFKLDEGTRMDDVVSALELTKGTRVSFFAGEKMLYKLNDLPRSGMVQVIEGQDTVVDPRFFKIIEPSDENSQPEECLPRVFNFHLSRGTTARWHGKIEFDTLGYKSFLELKKDLAKKLECLLNEIVIYCEGDKITTSDDFRKFHEQFHEKQYDASPEEQDIPIAWSIKIKTFIPTVSELLYYRAINCLDDATSDELKDMVIVFFIKKQFVYSDQDFLTIAVKRANALYQELCKKLEKKPNGTIAEELIGTIHAPVMVTDGQGNCLLSEEPLPSKEAGEMDDYSIRKLIENFNYDSSDSDSDL
jgi:hypothetical protein